MDTQNSNQNVPNDSAKEKGGVGSTAAIVIIVIVLILGALYLLGRVKPVNAPEADKLPPLKTSNDINSLESDLKSTPEDLGDTNLEDL
jgi:hypothetical protein